MQQESTASPQNQLPYSKIWPYILAGAIMCIVLLGGMISWSGTFKLAGAVIAPGVVVTASKAKEVQHFEGGIIGAIYVREGEEVSAGDLLIRLDDTEIKSSLTTVETQLMEYLCNEARLHAERDQLVAPIKPRDRLEMVSEKVAEQIWLAQLNLFYTRQKTRAEKITQLMEKIKNHNRKLLGLEIQEKAHIVKEKINKQELQTAHNLYQKGHESAIRLIELSHSQAEIKGNQGEIITRIAGVRNEIGETRLAVLDIQTKFHEQVLEYISNAQTKIVDLKERRISLKERLRRLDINAPKSGIILNLTVHTLGGVVSPGTTIMEVVPKGEHLVVEAQVNPQDIDLLHRDQPVVVRFSALDEETTPELEGSVINISADRLVENGTMRPYYLVQLKIPDAQLEDLEQIKLVPGMPADVFFQTSERTVFNYFLKPIADKMEFAFKEN